MFSGKIKKSSIFILAFVAFISAAVLCFGNLKPAAADVDPRGSFVYVENGEEAYAALNVSDYSDKEELKAMLENISGLSFGYASAISPENFNAEEASLEELFAALESYNAFASAVNEYNAAQTHGAGYAVAVPETFGYRNGVDLVSVKTDILPAVAEKAYASLKNNAEGWENVTEYEYALKYSLNNAQGSKLFEVYTSEKGEPLIITVSDECEFIENKASNGVVELVFTENGTTYTVIASLNRKTEITSDITASKIYIVNVLKIYNGSSSDNGAEVIYDKKAGTGSPIFTAEIDQSYSAYAATVGEILSSAKKYFETPSAETVREKYGQWAEQISVKINAVKTVAKDTVISYAAEINKELYSETALNEINAAAENGSAKVEAAENYAELVSALEEAHSSVKGVKSIPELFKETYASVIVKDLVFAGGYSGAECGKALEALQAYAGYNAAVKAELGIYNNIITDNIINTALSEINSEVEELDTEKFADNQLREIAAKRQKALQDVASAGRDFESIDEIVTSFINYIETLNSYGIVEVLESGNVKIEGKLDKNAVINVNTAVIADQDIAALENGKKQNSVTRRLTALEVFDINLSVNSKPILTAAGDSEYAVTVKLSEETIGKFKLAGIEGGSVLVAYVDGNGSLEIFETTLTFKYENGTTVQYTEPGSVEWDKIAEGYIMFITKHFSSYYLMGNTSNLALSRLTNLLTGLLDSEVLMYLVYGLAGLVGAILVFLLISFICSVCKRYKIVFVTNGGTKLKKLKRKYGKKLPELKVPERAGYVFSGWYIDPSLKYEFNRKVMPRANTTVYAKWISEEELKAQQENDKKGVLVAYYDKLRAKLASYKKVVAEGEKSFVAQDVLAKLYAEEDHIKLYVKTKLANLKDENGKTYIVAESDKFEEGIVFDELSYNNAVIAIERMAALNGLEKGEEIEVGASTYDDAVLGYAYIINYENVADFDERYSALRAYVMSFGISHPEKAENGKLVLELLPENKTLLDLTLALDTERYSAILENKSTIGELSGVYTITDGTNMAVALELIERVMEENGFTAEDMEVAAETFNSSEAYQYVINIAEEKAEEPAAEEPAEEINEEPEQTEEPAEEIEEELSLAEMFAQYRAYVKSFVLLSDENGEEDRTNDGKLVLRAKLTDEAIESTLDPEDDAESFTFTDNAGFAAAKEKVAAVMAKYGFEEGDESEADTEPAASNYFGYRIKFPKASTPEELLSEIRNYVNGFAMFAEEGVEPDASLDGTVVVKASLVEGAVAVTVDPDAEAEEFTVANDADVLPVKQAVDAVMAKYGLEPDPDYSPAENRAEGDSFGFRIKF